MKTFKGLIDLTFREGQQSPLMFSLPKYRFGLNEKKRIAKLLLKLGVRVFEFFSPVVNEMEALDFERLRDYIKSLSFNQARLLAHCRVNYHDVHAAIKTGFDGVNLYLRLSDIAEDLYGKSLSEITEMTKKLVISLRSQFPDIYIRFSCEDAFRTSLESIISVYDQLCEYVNTFGFPDTTGMATPEEVRDRLKVLIKRYPRVDFECHFHNDRGFSLINSFEAVKNGCHWVDVSVLGLGERSGITSVTGMLFNLYHLDKELVANYNLKYCYPLNNFVAKVLGIDIPYSEPISLINKSHVAGVHQAAILKMKQSYETQSLENFGLKKSRILLGPLTGWHAIKNYIQQVFKYEISEEEAKTITKEFKRWVVKHKNWSCNQILLKLSERFKIWGLTLQHGG